MVDAEAHGSTRIGSKGRGGRKGGSLAVETSLSAVSEAHSGIWCESGAWPRLDAGAARAAGPQGGIGYPDGGIGYPAAPLPMESGPRNGVSHLLAAKRSNDAERII